MKGFLKISQALVVLGFTLMSFALAFLFNHLGHFDQGTQFPLGLAKQYGKVLLNPNSGENPVQTERFISVKGVTELELQVDASAIEISPSDSDQVDVISFGTAGPSLKDKTSGSKLFVKEVENENGVYFRISSGKIKGMHSWFDSDGSRFLLKLPSSIKKLTLHSRSGDLKLSGLTLDQLSSEVNSGDVKTEKLTVKNVNLTSESGDLVWEGESSTLKVRSVSGNLLLSIASASPEVDVTNNSGEVTMNLGQTVDAEVHATTSTGEIKWLHQASSKLGTGKGSIQLKTDSGNITIDLAGAHS